MERQNPANPATTHRARGTNRRDKRDKRDAPPPSATTSARRTAGPAAGRRIRSHRGERAKRPSESFGQRRRVSDEASLGGEQTRAVKVIAALGLATGLDSDYSTQPRSPATTQRLASWRISGCPPVARSRENHASSEACAARRSAATPGGRSRSSRPAHAPRPNSLLSVGPVCAAAAPPRAPSRYGSRLASRSALGDFTLQPPCSGARTRRVPQPALRRSTPKAARPTCSQCQRGRSPSGRQLRRRQRTPTRRGAAYTRPPCRGP
jgi:hypothetical protein